MSLTIHIRFFQNFIETRVYDNTGDYLDREEFNIRLNETKAQLYARILVRLNYVNVIQGRLYRFIRH